MTILLVYVITLLCEFLADISSSKSDLRRPKFLRRPSFKKGSFSMLRSHRCTILIYIFLMRCTKIFLRAPLAPLYTNLILRVERAPKKRNFLVKIFQKVAYLGRNRVFIVLWKSSENHFGRPRKKSWQNFFFFKSAPPSIKSWILHPWLAELFV